MGILSTVSVKKDYLKMRWGEPYVSDGLNRKNFGVWPDGVYQGFTIGPGGLSGRDILVGPGSVSGGISPVVSGPGYLSGNFDATQGYSIAVFNDPTGFSATVQIPSGSPDSFYHLDATGLDGQTVFVVLNVQYSIMQESAMQLLLVDSAYIDANPHTIVLGNVQVPANPLVNLNAVDFQYAHPTYPRKSPLGSPKRAGLMPPEAWGVLEQNMPWQFLLLMAPDPNNAFNISIRPSQFTANGIRLYTFVQDEIASKFPRNAIGKYNGGIDNTSLTLMNIQTGVIGGAHQIPSNLSFQIPSVSGTPNSYQLGLVTLANDDTLNVIYGGIFSTVAGAIDDDNIPVTRPGLLQIGAFVVSTDGSGNILPLQNLNVQNPILWRRPYLKLSSGLGPQPDFVHETPLVISQVSGIYQLSKTPASAQSVMMLVDDLGPSVSGTFTVSGQLVEFTAGNIPALGQSVRAYYISSTQSQVYGHYDTPTPSIGDGINSSFLLNGLPANAASVMVMVNGRFVDNATWGLLQGATTASIVFTPGNAPAMGSSVLVWYLVNVASFASVSGGGGGSGSYVVSGSVFSPNVLNVAITIPVTADSRQLKYVVSAGGAQVFTAVPQIAPGSFVGQELNIFGTSDTNYNILQDGNGLAINGSVSLKNKQNIKLIWDGIVWSEDGRR